MKRSSLIVFAALAVPVSAADAVAPVDYTTRNARYAPARTIEPEKRAPVIAEQVQTRRVTPDIVTRHDAALGNARAAIEVAETREKRIRQPESEAPQAVEQPRSGFNQQRAAISTRDTRSPPVVARYQDSLAAASASNMARFPATAGVTTTKVNRFVFRRNGTEPALAGERASIVPAAGGSAPAK